MTLRMNVTKMSLASTPDDEFPSLPLRKTVYAVEVSTIYIPTPHRWALVPAPTPNPAISVFTRDLVASVVESAQNLPPHQISA